MHYIHDTAPFVSMYACSMHCPWTAVPNMLWVARYNGVLMI